jgi:uncharacterized repeat protein (TIGR03806 family)
MHKVGIVVWWLIATPAFAQGLFDRPANPTCALPARPESAGLRVSVRPLFPGASLSQPLAIAQSPTDPNVWWAAERIGDVRRLRSDLASTTRALSIRDRVVIDGEGGLLGLALHPQFEGNGEVYLYYTAAGPSVDVPVVTVVSRFLSHDGGLTFDPASEQVILRIDQPSVIHKGGDIHFGPDGFLYIGLGDGGHSANAQDPSSLLGSFLRIDVDSAVPYAIPPDNPFAAGGAGAPEVWAWGFRNPYRWSFDPLTGDLFAGDVGQAAWEEIDRVGPGANYGWPIREGAHCNGQGPCDASGLADPVLEYSHEAGCAVVAGPVYRGQALPALEGALLFADYCSARIRAALPTSGGLRAPIDLHTSPVAIQGFGQDADGEILVLRVDGVFRIVPSADPEPPPFPETLSATGCVDPLDPSKPAEGLIPFDVVEPLWSDGAEKQRWLALPDGARIHVAEDGDFVLPVGSVTMKTFSLSGRLVESRLFVRHEDGGWAGYSYAWNEAQTDAFLLAGGEEREIGGQRWTYPSREQCMSCHTNAAGYTLGLEVLQLNRELRYPSTGLSANQLATFDHIGLLDAPLPAAPRELPFLSRSSLDASARSYLHANCSNCHRPYGSVWTPELSFSIPSPELRACDWWPSFGDLGVTGARVLVPGDPSRSLLSLRPHHIGAGQMPPLARSTVDPEGTRRIDAWIEAWTSCAGPDGDRDGILDASDNCAYTANAGQEDANGNEIGDACETACNDAIDNDGDGRIDYPWDPSCASPSGDAENHAPELAAIEPVVVEEGATLSFQVRALDPEGDPLDFEHSPLPTGAQLTQQGVLTWRPSHDRVGCGGVESFPIAVEVRDPHGGHASGQLVLELRDSPTGSAPELVELSDRSVPAGEPLEIQVAASDADGDLVLLTASPLPSGAEFGPAGILRWIPTLAQVGVHRIDFDARDCTGRSARRTVAVEVRSAPPHLTSLDRSSGTKRDEVELRGVNFSGRKVKVLFGQKHAKVYEQSDSRLVVRVPQRGDRAPATQAVTVVRDGVESDNSLAFTYLEAASENP